MECVENCLNIDIKCEKCDGSLYYRVEKAKRPKIFKSNRGGARLEQETMRMQPNSGATRYRKGDLISAHTIIECKSTSHASIRITKEMIDTIEDYARKEIVMPVLNFSICDNEKEIYSIVKYRDLMALMDEISILKQSK